MIWVQVHRMIKTQSICNEEAEKGTRKVLNRRNTQHHLPLSLILISVFCSHIASIWATSVGHPREEVQPELSLRDEIMSMQDLRSKKGIGLTEGRYMLTLFTKSNPELAGVTDIRYFPYIYRAKEYADLDIAKYNMKDIQYKVIMPIGAHILRILDSSTDESSKRKCNRVFVKLLYSFYRFQITSLLIKDIRIGPEDQEILELQGIKNSVLKADRLVFRNVTTETIRVFLNRLNNISVGRLCIEGCDVITLDDVITFGNRYEINGIELTEVKIASSSCKMFLDRVMRIKHLKMCQVQFVSIQVLRDLLSILAGTLEIDLGVYKLVPKESWAMYASWIRRLHLIDIGNIKSIEEGLRDTSSTFPSLTTLALSVRHTELLDALFLSSVIVQVKKYYGGVKNITIVGEIDMENVKKAIRDNESDIAQKLQEHANTRFIFIESTGIELTRKHLLFIPLSMYREVSNVELERGFNVLGEISSWVWDKQRGDEVLCKTCKTKQESYVTQLIYGGVTCVCLIKKNIKQQRTSTDADKSLYLVNTEYIWYPRCIIFLHLELEGQVYLAETESIFKRTLKDRDSLMVAAKHEAKDTKKSVTRIHPIQNPMISTSMANTNVTWQQQEPRSGSSWHTGECTTGYFYYTPAQPTAAKRARYELAANERSIFAQPVAHRTHKVDHSESMKMSGQIEMQLGEKPQQYRDAERSKSHSENKSRHWLVELFEETLNPEPVEQQAKQSQTMNMFGGLPVATGQNLERHLGVDTVEPEEEFIWTQL